MMLGSLFGRSGALVIALTAFVAAPAAAATVQINPTKDNSLFEIGDGSLSNGAGSYLFAGTTAVGELRRALLAFDIAGNVPAGSVINSVTLKLNVSKEPLGNTFTHDFFFHRATADWGEGSSDAAGEEGTGALATSGDATWIHTFFNSALWATIGGDFSASPSAATSVAPGLGQISASSAGLTADVQAWLDTPGTNFGWIVLGEEGGGVLASARRFDSRTGPTAPVLEIDFSPAAPSVSLWGLLALSLIMIGTATFAMRRRDDAASV